MAENISLEFLGAHISRLHADMSGVQSELERLTCEGSAMVTNITELTLKLAHMERAIGDLRSYVDVRTVDLLQYGLGTLKDELTTFARQRGQS